MKWLSSTIYFLRSIFLSKSLDNWNLAELASTLTILIEILVVVFVICEIGESVTIQFETFEMELSQCEWFLLPIKMQRMYLIFVAHTQQEQNIHGYGNITCSRETFKKVSFSWNMYLFEWKNTVILTSLIYILSPYFIQISILRNK